MMQSRAEEFFEYARRRQQILLDRLNGRPAPWTNDPILQKYRFCNVFREDDAVTGWFKENIRTPVDIAFDGWTTVWACMVFRWFNKIETGEILLRDVAVPGYTQLKPFVTHCPDYIRSRLAGVSPLVTGAYMIKTPTGLNKLDGILDCLEKAWPQINGAMGEEIASGQCTMQRANELLSTLPFIGDFMAYEIVCDLRHTSVLKNASDRCSWANPGPGAARGYARILNKPLNHFNRHKPSDREELILGMQALLNLSWRDKYWPAEWGKWEMREVEHTLCEFDKYERARLGEGKPKQLFRKGA